MTGVIAGGTGDDARCRRDRVDTALIMLDSWHVHRLYYHGL